MRLNLPDVVQAASALAINAAAIDTAIKTGQENDFSACSTVMLQGGHCYIEQALRFHGPVAHRQFGGALYLPAACLPACHCLCPVLSSPRTRSAHLEHEQARAELKGLMPEDAKEATGHGIRAKRSKSGAVSFDILSIESGHAPVQ